MVGALDETRESIEATKRLLKELDFNTIFVAITTPMPCTRLYNQAQNEGRLYTSWEHFDFLGNLTTTAGIKSNELPMKLKYVSNKDVIDARQSILRSFYIRKIRSPFYLFNFLRKNGLRYT